VRGLWQRGDFAGSYGWGSAGRFHHAQSRLRRFLNLAGGFVGARDTFFHAAAEILFPLVLGQSNHAAQYGCISWPLLAQNCALLLAFSRIFGRTAQINSAGKSQQEVTGWLSRLRAGGQPLAAGQCFSWGGMVGDPSG
jgi:biotin/methionine sulfoxide reductase